MQHLKYMTHQPRTMYDPNNGTMDLYWDANGNLVQVIGCKQNSGRLHEWDVKRNSRTEKSPVDSSRSKCGARVCQSKHRTQLDRLRFVLGDKHAGYYGYDANGERVYKLTGTCGIDQINHNGTRAYVMFDDAVLYPNPYLVVTPRGYTKHYYAGTERLATAIGYGGFDDMGRTIRHYASREEDIAQMFYANYQNEDPFHYYHILSEMIGTSTIEGDNMPGLEYCQEPIILGRVDVIGGEDLLYSSIYDNLLVRDRERELFFSHSDHLGSANWITDYDGVPIQYLHYAPYGELIDNQQATQYDERYKFTGKERDWETGYDFFGARSYASVLSIWLSPDPLSNKYPEISPYAYCNWNPIKYVDPDGKKIVVGTWYGRALAKLGFNNYETKVQSHLQELKGMDPELNKMITKIEESDSEYHIISIDGNKFSYDDSTKEIYYNPDSKETKSGKKRPAQVGLAHELGHAENDVDGATVKYDKNKARQGDQVELDKWNKNELNSIDKENIVRDNYKCEERPYNYFTNEDY